MTTRRHLLKVGAAISAGTLFFTGESLQDIPQVFASVQVPQTPLPGASIPKYVDLLPTFVGQRVSSTSLIVKIQEFQQKVLPEEIYAKLTTQYQAGTYLWGYKVDNRPVSYPGFTIEAHRNCPTTVTYVNMLPFPNKSKLEPLLTIDQTIHWADPLKQMGSFEPYKGPIPTVTHLHGGEVPSAFDGGPNQWFTRNGIHGKGYATLKPTSANSAIYRYPNSQQATTMLFHDHTLGATRINVFSGLIGGYFLRDQFDTGLPDNPLRLPSGQQEIELVLQDRQFDTNGQLLFPDGHPSGLNGPPPNPKVHPYWIPEFFGDVIVVNGKSWPFLNVEPRRYRFHFLDGANARFFRMRLVDTTSGARGPAFWQIGTDGGLLDFPVQLNDPNDPSSLQLLIAPGERADIIIDFANLEGHSFTLVNDAPAPYPGGNPDTLNPDTNGQIMQFRVNLPLSCPDTTYNPANGGSLRGGKHQEPPIVRLANPQTGMLAAGVQPSVKRQLVLIQADNPAGGPIEVLLNNTKWDGIRDGTNMPVPGSRPATMGQRDFLTELPEVGSTEVWEIINLTPDAHPIHIHLIQFQLLNRQNFDDVNYRKKYDSLFPGGRFAGLKPDGTWGKVLYQPGVYIPGFGPPLRYNVPNAAGAIGGNPDVGPYLLGGIMPPDANEAGWKDTVKMYPFQVTRIVARWAPQGVPVNKVKPGQNLYPFDPTVGPGYAWHCHIIDHEDNEMMRPYSPVSCHKKDK
jgi:spore coat protein A